MLLASIVSFGAFTGSSSDGAVIQRDTCWRHDLIAIRYDRALQEDIRSLANMGGRKNSKYFECAFLGYPKFDY
ncbi:hypothetical protein BDV30DRAFT_160712 [Aspergillus minisclerotigenes]|uniref:Uncharacterized protein n=1 Tax=Aspergillus minisclerotigenes TaxID=656917 RepID=A0A5N6IVR3_9EURO|nr:hypothetical protein BDV30DRAFT_160712 [Aspergillus minisclerotigenes]